MLKTSHGFEVVKTPDGGHATLSHGEDWFQVLRQRDDDSMELIEAAHGISREAVEKAVARWRHPVAS